ncbi:MAG: hypothetical protein R6U89_08425 [Dehalococcoidia bacterium]
MAQLEEIAVKNVLIIPMLLAIVLSTGCAEKSSQESLDGIGSIYTTNYANEVLEYYYYIPASINDAPQKSYPMLVMIPGLSGLGEHFVSQQYKQFAETEGFIVASPSFVWDKDNWDFKRSYQYPSAWSGDALLNIIDQFETQNGISISKLYLFGISAGAQFALRFCLWKPDQCAACAAHGSGGRVIPSNYIDVAFLISVGEQDIPDRHAHWRDFCNAAKKLGIEVQCNRYDVGHRLSINQINDSLDFFKQYR